MAIGRANIGKQIAPGLRGGQKKKKKPRKRGGKELYKKSNAKKR